MEYKIHSSRDVLGWTEKANEYAGQAVYALRRYAYVPMSCTPTRAFQRCDVILTCLSKEGGGYDRQISSFGQDYWPTNGLSVNITTTSACFET